MESLGRSWLRPWQRTTACASPITEDHDIYVQDYLYWAFCHEHDLKSGAGSVPYVITWTDAAEVFRPSLEIDLKNLPSRCEDFLILSDDVPGKYLDDKLKRVLGFKPKNDVTKLWQKAVSTQR